MDDINTAAAPAAGAQTLTASLVTAAEPIVADVVKTGAPSAAVQTPPASPALASAAAPQALLAPDEIAKIAGDAVDAAVSKLQAPAQIPAAVVTAMATDIKPFVNVQSVIGVLVLLAGYFLAKNGHAVDASTSSSITDAMSQILVVGGALLTDVTSIFRPRLKA